MKQHQAKQEGFTIIEMMLVLAIAALIFLMVFVALPALQRGQRDTARKNDVQNIAAAVTQYTSNNRGKFPDSNGLKGYLGDLSNLDKESITVQDNAGNGTVTPSTESAIVVKGVRCDATNSDGATLKKGTSKQFVVVTKLEAGGNGVAYCLES